MSEYIRFTRVDGNHKDTVYVNPDRVAYVREGRSPTIYLDAGYYITVEENIHEVVAKLKEGK